MKRKIKKLKNKLLSEHDQLKQGMAGQMEQLKQEVLEEQQQQLDQHKQEVLEEQKQQLDQLKQEVLEEQKQQLDQRKQEVLEEQKQQLDQHKQEVLEEQKQQLDQHKQEVLEEQKQQLDQHKQEVLEEQQQLLDQHKQEVLEEQQQQLDQHKQEVLEEQKQQLDQHKQEVLEELVEELDEMQEDTFEGLKDLLDEQRHQQQQELGNAVTQVEKRLATVAKTVAKQLQKPAFRGKAFRRTPGAAATSCGYGDAEGAPGIDAGTAPLQNQPASPAAAADVLEEEQNQVVAGGPSMLQIAVNTPLPNVNDGFSDGEEDGGAAADATRPEPAEADVGAAVRDRRGLVSWQSLRNALPSQPPHPQAHVAFPPYEQQELQDVQLQHLDAEGGGVVQQELAAVAAAAAVGDEGSQEGSEMDEQEEGRRTAAAARGDPGGQLQQEQLYNASASLILQQLQAGAAAAAVGDEGSQEGLELDEQEEGRRAMLTAAAARGDPGGQQLQQEQFYGGSALLIAQQLQARAVMYGAMEVDEQQPWHEEQQQRLGGSPELLSALAATRADFNQPRPAVGTDGVVFGVPFSGTEQRVAGGVSLMQSAPRGKPAGISAANGAAGMGLYGQRGNTGARKGGWGGARLPPPSAAAASALLQSGDAMFTSSAESLQIRDMPYNAYSADSNPMTTAVGSGGAGGGSKSITRTGCPAAANSNGIAGGTVAASSSSRPSRMMLAAGRGGFASTSNPYGTAARLGGKKVQSGGYGQKAGFGQGGAAPGRLGKGRGGEVAVPGMRTAARGGGVGGLQSAAAAAAASGSSLTLPVEVARQLLHGRPGVQGGNRGGIAFGRAPPPLAAARQQAGRREGRMASGSKLIMEPYAAQAKASEPQLQQRRRVSAVRSNPDPEAGDASAAAAGFNENGDEELEEEAP